MDTHRSSPVPGRTIAYSTRAYFLEALAYLAFAGCGIVLYFVVKPAHERAAATVRSAGFETGSIFDVLTLTLFPFVCVAVGVVFFFEHIKLVFQRRRLIVGWDRVQLVTHDDRVIGQVLYENIVDVTLKGTIRIYLSSRVHSWNFWAKRNLLDVADRRSADRPHYRVHSLFKMPKKLVFELLRNKWLEYRRRDTEPAEFDEVEVVAEERSSNPSRPRRDHPPNRQGSIRQ